MHLSNLEYLEYVLVIAQESSISKAAQKLYIAQPNLSHILNKVEKQLGVKLFIRTSKGVKLTEKGEQFVSYAVTILSQIKELSKLCSKPENKQISFSVSVVRSSYLPMALSEWINQNIMKDIPILIDLIETNSLQVIQNVFNGTSYLGVIRCPNALEEYFMQTLRNKLLDYTVLLEFKMLLCFSETHPLARYKEVPVEELFPYTELIYGDRDPSVKRNINGSYFQELTKGRKCIFIYDRGSEIHLLSAIKGSYCWAAPSPQLSLRKENVIVRKSNSRLRMYKDIIIFRKNEAKGKKIISVIECMKQYADNLKKETEELLH